MLVTKKWTVLFDKKKEHILQRDIGVFLIHILSSLWLSLVSWIFFLHGKSAKWKRNTHTFLIMIYCFVIHDTPHKFIYNIFIFHFVSVRISKEPLFVVMLPDDDDTWDPLWCCIFLRDPYSTIFLLLKIKIHTNIYAYSCKTHPHSFCAPQQQQQ